MYGSGTGLMTLADALPSIAFVVDPRDARLRAVVQAHHDDVWRFLRRMGIPEAHVEDAVQQVLWIFARRAASVDPDAERPFLFGTAVRVASDYRRKAHVTREVGDDRAVLEHRDPHPDAERKLLEDEKRRVLDRILDALDPDLRAVFVLAELEELTMAEIARLLAIPAGTVASRLRRARAVVETRAEKERERFEEDAAR
jgi:RNA polymerase sigma-70 factor (ECF subfamily)